MASMPSQLTRTSCSQAAGLVFRLYPGQTADQDELALRDGLGLLALHLLSFPVLLSQWGRIFP